MRIALSYSHGLGARVGGAARASNPLLARHASSAAGQAQGPRHTAAGAAPACACCPGGAADHVHTKASAGGGRRAGALSASAPSLFAATALASAARSGRRSLWAVASAPAAFATEEDLMAAFEGAWTTHIASLESAGYFKSDMASLADPSEAGAMKRAHLQFARARGDVLYALDKAKVSALAAAPLPYKDRKTGNAQRRMAATFVDGADLSTGEGGTASTQDLVRLLLAAHFSASAQRAGGSAAAAAAAGDDGEEEVGGAGGEDDSLLDGGATMKSPDFIEAAVALLADVGGLMASPPSAEAVAAAAAAAAARTAAYATLAPEEGGGDQARVGRNSRAMAGDRWGGDRWAGDSGRRESRSYNNEGGSSWAASGDGPVSMDGPVMRRGDWMCPDCGAHCFASRSTCFRCSAERPASAGSAEDYAPGARGGYERGARGAGGGAEWAAPEPRPGDWDCPACAASNFARRRQCFKCGENAPPGVGGATSFRPPRGAGLGVRTGGERGAGGWEDRGPPPPREGDWTCSGCGFSNFASRYTCRECGAPGGNGGGGGGGGGGYRGREGGGGGGYRGGGGGGGGYRGGGDRGGGGGGYRGRGGGGGGYRGGGDRGGGGGGGWAGDATGGGAPAADLDW